MQHRWKNSYFDHLIILYKSRLHFHNWFLDYRVTAGSGFEQKKMSDSTLELDSYDQIRFKVGQNPDVLILGLFEKSR